MNRIAKHSRIRERLAVASDEVELPKAHSLHPDNKRKVTPDGHLHFVRCVSVDEFIEELRKSEFEEKGARS